MSLMTTGDGRHYRRWVNLIPTLCIPGSAQFLAGRRLESAALVSAFVTVDAIWAFLLLHPGTPWSVLDAGPLRWLPVVFLLLIAVNGFRHPIPRMGASKWGLYLLVCGAGPILAVAVFSVYVGLSFKVPSDSMLPTLKGVRTEAGGVEIPGDYVWVNRLAYLTHEPKRGDVVVFRTAGLPMVEQGEYYVKRVVGVPGETVGIDPPYVTVDGEHVTEPPVFRRIASCEGGHCGYAFPCGLPAGEIRFSAVSDSLGLGPSEYLVMGDRSTNSFDGRYYGPIRRSAIVGQAVYIYAPADRKGFVE